MYREHHTHSLYDITLAISVASFALYKTSHPHFMTSNHGLYVITPTILDIVSTVSVSPHPLYWWYHTNCISEITSAIIHNIISILYDMTDTVRHHNHCIHDIKLPTYDISYRVYDVSSPIHLTSHKLRLWIHVNYISHQTHGAKTIQPLYLKSQPPYVYLCVHTHCINDITHTVFMTWHLQYLWHSMHCIWHLTHDLWHHNTLSITSDYYISYQTDYIWQNIHCISVITPDDWSYNPHFMYDNTGTICMISYEYIWHHIHSLKYHTTLWH